MADKNKNSFSEYIVSFMIPPDADFAVNWYFAIRKPLSRIPMEYETILRQWYKM